jgi:hypothetical protein
MKFEELLISGYMKFPDFQFDRWLYEICSFSAICYACREGISGYMKCLHLVKFPGYACYAILVQIFSLISGYMKFPDFQFDQWPTQGSGPAKLCFFPGVVHYCV